jgi:crotonobetainyl-CoA:carnitine CoA-transferase CaiB-like acyl-CoA transferase
VLEGLRVLDLSTGIAGPYCTKLFADAGADVIKVEPPGGDPLRRWTGCGRDVGEGDGALFEFLNASKRSVTGDLTSPEVRALAREADLLVESFAPGVLESHRLHEANPRLVMVSISPFGHTGPWAHRPATEFTLQAWCGSTASRGKPDRPPLAAGGRVGEWVGGSYAAPAALVALRRARDTGAGDHLDVSLLECMSVSMNTYAYVFGSFLGFKRAPGPPRSIEIPSIEPTRDGYVGFCTITAQQFQDFLVLIGRPDLIEDKVLAQAAGRMRRMEEILAIIHAWTKRHTTDEIIELATAMRIPVAPIGNGESVVKMPHFVERGTFVHTPGGSFVQPRVPYRIEGATPPPATPAPRPGEHTGRAEWRAGAGGWGAGSTAARGGLPLEGLRVVDFTAFWAGPAGTHMLASLGADVVKVESVQRPDGMRFTSTAPPTTDKWWEWGPVFHGANTNKRSVTLDLTRPEGLELAKRLVSRADAVMENFTPRVMESFGLDWPAVQEANPRAVMVRMPGFGLNGPWRDRTGFAQTMEQVSGMAWVTGWEDGPPLIPRGVCDPAAGVHAVFALLVALEEVRRTGRGRLVEVTMVEVALNLAAAQVCEHGAYGALLGRHGNRSPDAAPQGLYACAGEEQWLAIAVETDEQWAALEDLLGNPAWAGAAGLSSKAARQANHDLLDREIARWAAGRDLSETVEALAKRGIPAAAAVAPVDLHENPQLRARGLLEPVSHPVTGTHALPGMPFRSSRHAGPWIRRPAPTLGQHNDEILAELGVDDDRRKQLRESGVVGERPARL